MALFVARLFTPIPKPLQFLSRNPLIIPKSLSIHSFAAAATSTPTTTTTTKKSSSTFQDFADRVSGEWDGFCADFTAAGEPVELPENVVPGAFREWEVQIFDWQTQCPTIVDVKEEPLLHYKVIRLLPTVGCEADAATRYSIEERVAGGPGGMSRVLGFDSRSGSYVAVWEMGALRIGEIEHCLVDPEDPERRVRVVLALGVEEGGMVRLGGIRVFCEHWEGPFRNGESLGGCAVKEAAFATTAKVELDEVLGVWQGTRFGVAGLDFDDKDIFHELVVEESYKSARDQLGIVTLPKKLWCSVKENKDSLRSCEVGWILNRGQAMISSCVFFSNGKLKEVTIGHEKAIAEEL